MKRFVALFVLLFLVALQLPKEWLHNHDYGHSNELAHHHDCDHDLDQDVNSFEKQDCFACDLTIDSFDGPMVPVKLLSIAPMRKVTEAYVQSLHAVLDLPYALRGPPVG